MTQVQFIKLIKQNKNFCLLKLRITILVLIKDNTKFDREKISESQRQKIQNSSNMQKLSSLNPDITFYIRTAKKIGFIQKSKKSVLNSTQLKEVTQRKTKIPAQSQILYYNGEQIKQSKSIKISDKSIVHVIDSRNVGKKKMKLSVKRLPQNSRTENFQVDSNTSIDEFIKKELEPFYEEPAEKLFFVYSGRQLKRQKSFSQEHVESQTQILCVHADKDRKTKREIVSARSSSNSLKSKDTIQTRTELTPRKQERLSEKNQQKVQTKVQNIIEERVNDKTQLSAQNIDERPQQILESSSKSQSLIKTAQNEQIQAKTQKKLIKSIEQIKCDQTESDQDEDDQRNSKEEQNYPQKLPEEYLIQLTRQRSNSKSDNNNNSGSSSISEANFKKKKKASQVESIKGSEQKREEQASPRSLNINSPAEKNKSEKERIEKLQVQDSKRQEEQNKFKTRDQIFESNLYTYSSVIDEPEQSFQMVNLQSANSYPQNQKEDIFKSYTNTQQEEIYDSQINYCQTNSSKIQVRGFMNFSSAFFLQPSQVQLHQIPSQQQQDISLRQSNTDAEIKNNETVSRIHNRAPESLPNQIENHIETHEMHENFFQPRKQSSHDIGGDSLRLSFSKEQSEVKPVEQSQDNLFVAYRRGPQPQNINSNIMIRENQITQSNLLSETQNNVHVPQTMNSFTFNLEANPDEVFSRSKQSEVHLIDENENQQQNQINYEKRQSEIETNFRDSANPSQVYSKNSSQIKHKPSDENIPIESPSLIEGLMQMMEYEINVNAIESENSDLQQSNPKQNYVDPESDISYDPQNQQPAKRPQQTIQTFNTNNPLPQNTLRQENSDIYVSYQLYTTKSESSFNNEAADNKQETQKQNESNQLEENSFGVTHEKSLQSGFLKNILISESQSHVQEEKNSAIKIVQENSSIINFQDEPEDQIQINQKFHNYHPTQQMQESAAFHEISQSINEKTGQSSNSIHNMNNPGPEEITFRKDHHPQENRYNERQSESKIQQPQGSKLLYELSLQAMNQTEKPQLLPGDYIYSTDRVQTPDEALDTILMGFAHCF